MQKISLIDPSPNDSPEQICWHNLKISDEFYNLNYFIYAAIGWLKLNPTKNYQDLEKELRERNFNTHLIAKKPQIKQNIDYECIFSCRPKQLALEELLKEWPSYEENFNNLSKAESMKVTNIDNKDSSIQKLNETQINEYELLSQNKKKILIEKILANNYLKEIVEICKKQFGKIPKQKIVGLSEKGGPVFALFIDDKLLSNIGFVIECDKTNEKVIKLFDLQNIIIY